MTVNDKKLFLLDGMALLYRAHFAFIRNPILTSTGINTSALFGFTQTLLDLIESQKPTHLAVAFDTAAPTARHVAFQAYKATREKMPEDLSLAIPNVFRMVEALSIPVIKQDGYEADDIIGTLVRRAEREGFVTYMVTSDKDFGQLVTENTWLFRPGKKGSEPEVWGVQEVLNKWGIQRVDQVIDILGLSGDAVDNIPGIPGIGDKTAAKLIAEYGSIENLLIHSDQLKGKQKENVEKFGEQGLLSKRLATIDTEVPIQVNWDELKITPPQEDALKTLCMEFEFNSIGRRLFGESFKAGRGAKATVVGNSSETADSSSSEQSDFLGVIQPDLKSIREVEHDYRIARTKEERTELAASLLSQSAFCFDLETTDLDPKRAEILGIAFSCQTGTGWYVPFPGDRPSTQSMLQEFETLFGRDSILKIGHNLKYDLSVLRWHEFRPKGPWFDTMIAHALIEPLQRHNMDYLAECYLGYSPISISKLIGEKKDGQLNMRDVPMEQVAEYAAEDADVTWQLHGLFKPRLTECGQEKVFYSIECPLIPVLVEMEHEGVRIDSEALKEISVSLQGTIDSLHRQIWQTAGTEFNINSPKQLGEVLYEKLRIIDKPKKTKTGQYSTNEQTLIALVNQHDIVRMILEYRGATKLKSTYVDALPREVFESTGRIHTTYNQAVTSTGRLQSQNPNLQNIPIRTEQGKEIRKAFVSRDDRHRLLAADYSQIELRIIAALSRDAGMLQAFDKNQDIHSATAAGIYGIDIGAVDAEMRRKAKMVNFGLMYGMSAFGLAQRLSISRSEAKTIMEAYFNRFPGIHEYMESTIRFAKKNEYVETVTGRRRYLRDINSSNGPTRSAAERTAINMPIQGTAADMIKIAMVDIQEALDSQGLRSKMLLQVHDELVFDLAVEETEIVVPLVEEKMKSAIDLNVPIVVEMGTGENWLDAH